MTQETCTTSGTGPGQNVQYGPSNPPADRDNPGQSPNPGQQSGGCPPPKPDPCQPTGGGTSPPAPQQRKCDPLDPGPKVPDICKPQFPDCPKTCCCPEKPKAGETCLDGLIDDQAKLLAAADRAKTFKADLEDILKKAKAAKQDYTKAKYKELCEKWKKQDRDIVDLIAKLVCAVRCWRCVIECEICPLIYAIRDTELELNGDGRLTDKVYSLRDQRSWLERNRDAKKDVFDRIKAVLSAWEKPAQSIEKILADNAKLIEDTKKILATDSVSAIYDVFMKLIPMHLAIKPKGEGSNIHPKYQNVCCGDVGKPDACCGPDVGRGSVSQRLIGPQPYLVDPDQFFDIICCLVNERYRDSKDQLADAEAELVAIDLKIKRYQTDLDQKRASIAADFKANVVNPIDCDEKYKPKNDGGGGPPACHPSTPTPAVT